MFKAIIHRLLLRHHFWRYATFDEVAELYASRTIRMFALRMVTVFTSIYLLQEGYGVLFLALFWGSFYGYKIFFSWPSARLVAWFGPKHSTLISNIFAGISMIFLPFVSGGNLWALGLWCIFQASSTCLYDLSYLVDFSKVKNVEHAGKEIAFMNILEKVASGVSPILGGILAFVAGPQVVMGVAAVLFLLAALPLFKTGEPVRTHQKLNFEGFPWRTTWRGFVAQAATGVDVFATGTAWTLFMAIIVFAGDGDEIYAKVGALTAVSLVAALLASYTFGKLIDRHQGGPLLRYSTIFNSLVHFLRAFISTPISVVLMNILNEAGTTGYSMAFTRGLFDTADASGKRLAYLYIIEMAVNFGAMLGALLLALTVVLLTDTTALRVFFVVAAVVTLLIATPRFMLYRR